MKVGVVTGFIPIPVHHLSANQYHELALTLAGAVLSSGATFRAFVNEEPLASCWAYELCNGLPPANPVPADRYASPEINVMSHIIQHQRTTWALRAAKREPDVAVWVWFDYGLMKQGDWTGKPIRAENVQRFLRKLADMKALDHIPFPGITDKQTVYPTGNVWRFCGSTHIWPKQYLPEIHDEYKARLIAWVHQLKTVPLDLPIWALVEQNLKLPFRWYPAEYDATQLDNLPGGV